MPETKPPTPDFDPNPNAHLVGPGFLEEAGRRKTQVLSDEMYLHGPTSDASLAVTGDGLLIYTAAGGVRFVPFE